MLIDADDICGYAPICVTNIWPESQWHQRVCYTYRGVTTSIERLFLNLSECKQFSYLCHPPKQGKTVELQEYDGKNIVRELDQVAVDHRRLVEVISGHLFWVEVIHVDVDNEFLPDTSPPTGPDRSFALEGMFPFHSQTLCDSRLVFWNQAEDHPGGRGQVNMTWVV